MMIVMCTVNTLPVVLCTTLSENVITSSNVTPEYIIPTHLATMIFDEILDLTADVFFYFIILIQ